MKLEKKHWIIIGVVVAIILVWYFFLRKKKPTESNYRKLDTKSQSDVSSQLGCPQGVFPCRKTITTSNGQSFNVIGCFCKKVNRVTLQGEYWNRESSYRMARKAPVVQSAQAASAALNYDTASLLIPKR